MTKATSVRFVLTLALALAASAGSARAELIHGSGVVSSFTGTFSYAASDASSATLVVSLTNTTPLPAGYLTGFAFNNPGGQISGVTVSSTDPEFTLLGGPTYQNNVPVFSLLPLGIGLFDVGASTGATIYGTPFTGLAPGESATFTFGLTGTGLDGLGAGSFFATGAAPFSDLPTLPRPFVASFTYFGVIPDVAAGQLDDRVQPAQVPEPTSAALAILGTGLVGASALRRRRVRQAEAATA